MLFGLRHPAVVRGDDEQGQVNRADAGDHVFYEIFVARDINYSNVELFATCVGNAQFGKPKIDGDAARLLLRQAVGIGARKRFNERALSVVDVPGGGNNKISRGHACEINDWTLPCRPRELHQRPNRPATKKWCVNPA